MIAGVNVENIYKKSSQTNVEIRKAFYKHVLADK
ncbi:MAG: hypothetical protein JWR61_2201 [Ferruginibacter sp.]|nr:hypothetical protein [Ferruginibacter sp.]